MKKKVVFISAAILAASSTFFLIAKKSENIYKEQRVIDGIVSPFVESNNFSGSIVLAKENKIIYENSFGKMDYRYNLENELNTKFYIASASMVFTSAAILKLVEKGAIKLEERVAKYIPEYIHGQKITIHQLLSERSGIPAIGKNSDVDYSAITEQPQTPSSLFKYFEKDSLLYMPGKRYSHERSGYILLALIIERTSGKSFGDFLKEEVFLPLEMYDTGHSYGGGEIIQNMSNGHQIQGLYGLELTNPIEWSSKTGHASIYSTAGDLIKFGNASLNSKLLNEGSWRKIFANHGDNVGYGWFIGEHLGKKRFHINGRSPGYSSFFCIYPKEKVVLAITSNLYGTVPTTLGKMIASHYFGQPYDQLALSKKVLLKEGVSEFVGTYQFNANFYVPNFRLKIYYKDNNLYTNWGGLLPIKKENDVVDSFILRAYWSKVEFKKESGGIIMSFDNHIGEKVE